MTKAWDGFKGTAWQENISVGQLVQATTLLTMAMKAF